MVRLIVLAAVMSFAAAMPVAHAQDLASLEKESTQLSGEKDEIAIKLDQSVKAKRADDHDFDVLKKEDLNIKAEKQQLEAKRPNVHALCSRTVPKEQFAAVTAQCNAVRIPFNTENDALNKVIDRYNKRREAVVKKEAERAAAEQKLRARADAVKTRQAAVRGAIALRLSSAKMQCMQDCVKEGKDDAMAYCLQRCWDNAVSGLSPVERNRQYQAQFGTRTVEQAIEDYKKSGPAYLGPSLKIKPPPSPSN